MLQVDFAEALLAASQDAYEAAFTSYTAGLADILDLLAAERDLARARMTAHRQPGRPAQLGCGAGVRGRRARGRRSSGRRSAERAHRALERDQIVAERRQRGEAPRS